jgi:hypothetical protein
LNVAIYKNTNYRQQSLPKPGQMRFFINPFSYLPHDHAIFINIEYYDRSIRHWQIIIEKWLSYKHMKNHTWYEYGKQLHQAFMFELRIRNIARKFIARLRHKVYKRRTVGLTNDLYTLEPIPASKQICVCDHKTRSIYYFHVKTILNCIKASLNYSIYGIASPTHPKNPYTNLPWEKNQLISIFQQIGCIFWNSYSEIPFEIMEFRKSYYDINTFLKANNKRLQIKAAHSLFEIYEEAKDDYTDVILDLYEDGVNEGQVFVGWFHVKKFLLQRKLSPELLKKWDSLVVSAWIYENHDFCYNITNYLELLYMFEILVNNSYAYLHRNRMIIHPTSIEYDS